jgi:hypothetical protein
VLLYDKQGACCRALLANLRNLKITEPAAYRIVLVDTNCFLRLYSLPRLPFWGSIGPYQLLTLPSLLDEFHAGARLNKDYAWLDKKLSAEDQQKITLVLGGDQLATMREERDAHRDYADSFLYDYCDSRKIGIRSLSKNDLELLATAIALRAAIATDEWPLKLLVEDLTRDNDADDYGIEVFTSVHMLRILENAGFISPEERVATMRSWLRSGEQLHRDWDRDYKALFKAGPPLAS